MFYVRASSFIKVTQLSNDTSQGYFFFCFLHRSSFSPGESFVWCTVLPAPSGVAVMEWTNFSFSSFLFFFFIFQLRGRFNFGNLPFASWEASFAWHKPKILLPSLRPTVAQHKGEKKKSSDFCVTCSCRDEDYICWLVICLTTVFLS